MNKIVHIFLESPVPTIIMANDVQFVIGQAQKLGLPFQPRFVVTDSIDPPFSKILLTGTPLRHTYMGHVTEQQFLGILGVPEQIHVVMSEDQRIPITMSSDLAFLAALDIAIERHGEDMPTELKSSLHSFIAAEKSRRGITE